MKVRGMCSVFLLASAVNSRVAAMNENAGKVFHEKRGEEVIRLLKPLTVVSDDAVWPHELAS